MTTCNIPLKPQAPQGLLLAESQGPDDVTWSQWLQVFNWVNWIGLTMFLLPVVIGYVIVHVWLWSHDPLCFYGSMYAQLALLCVAWKQL